MREVEDQPVPPVVPDQRLDDQVEKVVSPEREPSYEHVFPAFLGPLLGGVSMGIFAAPTGTPVESGALAFVLFLAAGLASARGVFWSSLLPGMALIRLVVAPLLAGAAFGAVGLLPGVPDVGLSGLLLASVMAAAVSALPRAMLLRSWRPSRSLRVGVIGSPRSARSLARELELAGITEYVVAGRIASAAETVDGDSAEEVATLGTVPELSRIITRHDIELLVMTGEVPRLAVFNEIAHSCLHLPVRLWELAGFYEDVFGHVPVAEINASWFQYIMHPRYRSGAAPGKRPLELLLAVLAALLLLPLMLVAALLIRRDGGPVLFRQKRIGEGGLPFVLYKLRTMREDAAPAAQWAAADDPRVTPIGRLLRHTHLDEMPQLINVIRGEMSLVGPRPEQPEFVDRLEERLPFYSRRHLLKPGITGWAQVRCGYAGSDSGSAWKLCHDLFYLKHRSLGFDLAIMAETVSTLLFRDRHPVEPNSVALIFDHERPPVPSSAPATSG